MIDDDCYGRPFVADRTRYIMGDHSRIGEIAYDGTVTWVD